MEEKIIASQQYVTELLRNKEYLKGHTGNVDETAVYLNMPLSTTVNETEKK